MDRDGVLQALGAGEFDGISHDYQPYDGYQKGTTHQLSMSVSSGTIEVTKITRGKFFDGKENTRFEERSPDFLTGNEAVDFIERHPYYFSLARPDLFWKGGHPPGLLRAASRDFRGPAIWMQAVDPGRRGIPHASREVSLWTRVTSPPEAPPRPCGQGRSYRSVDQAEVRVASPARGPGASHRIGKRE